MQYTWFLSQAMQLLLKVPPPTNNMNSSYSVTSPTRSSMAHGWSIEHIVSLDLKDALDSDSPPLTTDFNCCRDLGKVWNREQKLLKCDGDVWKKNVWKKKLCFFHTQKLLKCDGDRVARSRKPTNSIGTDICFLEIITLPPHCLHFCSNFVSSSRRKISSQRGQNRSTNRQGWQGSLRDSVAIGHSIRILWPTSTHLSQIGPI